MRLYAGSGAARYRPATLQRPRLEALEDLGFGARDPFKPVGKVADVRRCDRGDHGNVRPCERSEGADLPARFMPISTTAKGTSGGKRASVKGTPQWLLWLAALAWAPPWRLKTSASASLVPVLPTEPVTATSWARARARAARASP